MASENGWKKTLQDWAEREGITPAEFARKTGYSYQHSFNLLRGKTEVTEETLGRILVGFGSDVANEVVSCVQPPC
jgi:plasmid maintenance system antidote protein VapI